MKDPISALLGAWSADLCGASIVLRIALALVLSAIIGCERSSKRHSAGLRTFMVVSLATTVTMLLDVYLQQRTRFPLYLLSCGAVIGVAVVSVRSLLLSARSQIKGLTTAAGLWTCGILGLCTGAGLYTVTILGFLALLYCLTWFPWLERYLKNRSNHFEVHLELISPGYLKNFVSTIRRLGLKIDDIEKNTAYTGSGLSVYSISISISSQELKKYKSHRQIIEALRSLDYIYHIEEMNF